MYMLISPGPSTATIAMTSTRNGKVIDGIDQPPEQRIGQPPK